MLWFHCSSAFLVLFYIFISIPELLIQLFDFPYLPSLKILTTVSLTLTWWRFLWYRNQSIDWQRKLMDWFLYDRDLRHQRGNKVILLNLTNKIKWLAPDISSWSCLISCIDINTFPAFHELHGFRKAFSPF